MTFLRENALIIIFITIPVGKKKKKSLVGIEIRLMNKHRKLFLFHQNF